MHVGAPRAAATPRARRDTAPEAPRRAAPPQQRGRAEARPGGVCTARSWVARRGALARRRLRSCGGTLLGRRQFCTRGRVVRVASLREHTASGSAFSARGGAQTRGVRRALASSLRRGKGVGPGARVRRTFRARSRLATSQHAMRRRLGAARAAWTLVQPLAAASPPKRRLSAATWLAYVASGRGAWPRGEAR